MWPVTLQRVGSLAVLGLQVVRFRIATGSVADAILALAAVVLVSTG